MNLQTTTTLRRLVYSFSYLVLPVLFAWGQESLEKKWKNEPFGTFSMQDELVQMRDRNAKHFRNPDGTISAYIAIGDIHFWEDNQWKTIFHTIEPTDDGFQNVQNNVKSYFPTQTGGTLTTKLASGEQLVELKDMRMYYLSEAGAQRDIRSIAPSKGTATFNELVYPNVYGTGIDLRFLQETQVRKMDYVIQDLGALGVVPNEYQYLVFEETIEIPAGWRAQLLNNTIRLIDGSGQVRAEYTQPIIRDTPQAHHHDHSHDHDEVDFKHLSDHRDQRQQAIFDLIENGSHLIIRTKVPIAWLLDEHRNFPVYIDPTINFNPSNATGFSGSVNTWTAGLSSPASYTSTAIHESFNDRIFLGHACGSGYYDDAYFVGGSSISNSNDVVGNGWIKFNTATVPSSCITSATISTYVQSGYLTGSSCLTNVRVRHMAGDPVTQSNPDRLTDIRDGSVYADFNFVGGSSSWRTFGLNSTAFSSILSGTMSVGLETYDTYRSHHEHEYVLLSGYSSANKPYMVVTYTPDYLVSFSNPTNATLCGGQTANISVTAKNDGCQTWTSGSGTNVNFSWWGSWQTGGSCPGQDCNPRMFPFSSLAPGASQVVTFPVTLPTVAGTYTINVDLVREGVCWFRGNGAPSCGPGNPTYSFTITVTDAAVLTGPSNVCVGSTIDLNTSSEWISAPTGGIITTIGNDRVHRFTASGTFSTAQAIPNARILVIGGGGGGGSNGGGGGGAGGVYQNNNFAIASGATTVAVGGPGALHPNNATAPTPGGQSAFGAITAGGGGGGASRDNGVNGGGPGGTGTVNGSGGGGGGSESSVLRAGGIGASNGGVGFGGSCNSAGGGGGGAGGIGGNATSNVGGNGGAGIQSNITGTNTWYAAGGGGGLTGFVGCGGNNAWTGSNGIGGSGVGGNGEGAAPAANSGSGGGAEVAGAAGVVIVRYTMPQYASSNPSVATVNPVTGVVTAVSAGTTIITFTAVTGCTSTMSIQVSLPSSAPTAVSGGGAACHGQNVTLTPTGATPGTNPAYVWYKGGCNNAYTYTFSSATLPSWTGGTTINSLNGSVANLTSVNGDPMIDMAGIGSYDPNIYRYVNIRYRVLSGAAGSVEIFFYNTTHNFAVGGETGYGTLISDGSWHVVSVNMAADPDYLTGGNILGWRYDWATDSGVNMEVDFIQLSQYPIIDEDNSTPSLVLNYGSTHYPPAGQTITYASALVDNCGVSNCASTTVTSPATSANLGNHGDQATCLVNQNGWVHFYHSSGRLLASVNSGGNNLGNVSVTQYDDGAPVSVLACNAPTDLVYRVHAMERHWKITPTNNGAAVVRLPFYDSELTSLTASANGNQNPNDNLAGRATVRLSKYSGGVFPASVNVDGSAANNCTSAGGAGGTIVVMQSGNGVSNATAFPQAVSPAAGYVDFPITGFSEFWLHGASSSPLPVDLLSFSGTCSSAGIQLNWVTGSEINNSHFVIERSRDMLTWEEIAQVSGMGTSSQSTLYTYNDPSGFGGYYYRLTQLDLNGEEYQKSPIHVSCEVEETTVSVYPNPTNDAFTLGIHASTEFNDISLEVFDVTGKLITKRIEDVSKGVNEFYFDSQLESGTYLIQVTMGEEKQIVRLVVRN